MRSNSTNERRPTGDEPDPRLDVFDQAAWDASFDASDFDDRDVQVPDSFPNAAAVFAEIQLSINALAGTSSRAYPDNDEPDLLFRHQQGAVVVQCKRRRAELWSVVVRAYRDIRCDRSVDYVVAEPEANLLFLHRCWELGAAASPFELNWILMNARKDHRMQSSSRSKPVFLGKDVFDNVTYAADIAMRELQNELYFKDQRGMLSVDQILCSPQLVNRFDTRASRISPGFRTFDYRWAVLGLRKARRAKARAGFPIGLQSIGLIEDARKDRLPKSSGLYWVTSGTNSLFVGVANNLQRQVLSLAERLYCDDMIQQLNPRSTEKPSLKIMESGVVWAEMYRTRVLKDRGSLLNFQLFKALQPAA